MCLHGIAVQSLHGDREQCDREEALKDFKESMLQGENLALNLYFFVFPVSFQLL